MKKRPIIRNVTIQPGTHKIILAHKKRTGINIKTIVDRALREYCDGPQGKQASA